MTRGTGHGRRPPVAATLATAGLVLLGLAGGGALAAPETRVVAERLAPAPGRPAGWVCEGARVRGHLWLELGLSWSMAQRPLALRLAEDPAEELDVVQRSSLVQLGVAAELWHQLRLGVALPLLLRKGDGFSAVGGSRLTSAALADLRLHATAALLSGALASRVQLALGAVLSLPTGDDAGLASADAVGVEPRWLLSVQPLELLLLHGQLGVALQPGRQLFGARWGHRLRWAAAVELLLPWGRGPARQLALVGELDGASCSGCSGPLELRGGARLRWRAWRLSLGAGAGLGSGMLVPAWRILGGVGVSLPR